MAQVFRGVVDSKRPTPNCSAGSRRPGWGRRGCGVRKRWSAATGRWCTGARRRVLGHSADVDDAFQATFLVLLRKANAVREPGALGNWLYGVAVRTATHLKAQAGRRRTLPLEAGAEVPAPTADDRADLLSALDQELALLPDRYRIVLVLCELEGHTLRRAAEVLGVPPGTVASRLARGRRTLARRLIRRGFPPTAVALGPAFAEAARATPPWSLVRAAVALSPDGAPERISWVVSSTLTESLKMQRSSRG